MASPPIVQVFDNDKNEESRDIEECLRKIDSLFEDGIFVDQEDTILKKEIDAAQEEVVVEAKVVAKEDKFAKNENEKVKENFVEKVVIVPESVGANLDNLEQNGARLAEIVRSPVRGNLIHRQ
ncbi:hypothetical protein PVK06_030217 [Gossypium arboreum]|uniref:Uncharacterized protein n=1 Tax=Gossypium arboreum TaxID=29729 RepID=A0ABR0NMP8_GOSAR|nr:hypothetical protein PVK06_030217 [Gossypium arboreum]